MVTDPHCLIIGSGHAGIQAASLLREKGYTGHITLFSEEQDIPYQKPPLSKGFLMGKQGIENIWFRNPAYFEENKITLALGVKITSIHPDTSEICSSTGERWPFTDLILATGARNRNLAFQAELGEKAIGLRTLQDALRLQENLTQAHRIALVGGGFIGLETAAAAIDMGKQVTVFEAGDRILARVLPSVLSSVFHQKHVDKGVDIRLKSQVTPAQLADFDLVVVGIGVEPNQELAQAAGLTCANGIVVDAFQQTSHPHIYAIGDCAVHENRYARGQVRLESVQNANDQAKTAVMHILGQPQPYVDVPWFWTHQYDLKLQMAGISTGYDRYEITGDPDLGKCSVYYYQNDRLIGVDSLNKPADHLQARKTLAHVP